MQLILAIGTAFVGTHCSDYVSFGGTPAERSALFFDPLAAQPAVVAEESRLANRALAGEITSVVVQPSGALLGSIRVPVLLVLADRDRLFPAAAGPSELARFTSSPDALLLTAPDCGHVIFLHPRGRAAVNDMVAWLRRHRSELPACW